MKSYRRTAVNILHRLVTGSMDPPCVSSRPLKTHLHLSCCSIHFPQSSPWHSHGRSNWAQAAWRKGTRQV